MQVNGEKIKAEKSHLYVCGGGGKLSISSMTQPISLSLDDI